MRRYLATTAFALLILGVAAGVQATTYIVDDSNFVGEVYNFSYSTKLNEADNGGTLINGDPWLSNNGWTHDPNRTENVGDWRLPGGTFSNYVGPGVSGTLGFDFSGVNSAIQKVEINPSHKLFCYENPSTTQGDTIKGEVRTPGSFGTGLFTEMYGIVGPSNADCPTGDEVGQVGPTPRMGGWFDVTPYLSATWLSDPGLLEFQFSYMNAFNDPAAIAEQAQVFRQDIWNNGFDLRVTLVVGIEISMDIKPGSDPNSVNPTSGGVIPVAVLSTADFDATTVDPLTVTFGPGEAMAAHADGHIEDVDGDGRQDLVLHFGTRETGIQCGDTEAMLAGKTFAGQAVEGSDAVNTVGCE